MFKVKSSILLFFIFQVELSWAQLEFIEKKNESPDTCALFIKTIEDQFNYGWVEAPLNYDQPQGEKARIFYYYKKATNFKNPVVFFNGGPGYDSSSSSTVLEQALTKFELNGKIDFIYLDQRGTGCSTPHFALGADTNTLENLKWAASLGIVEDAELVRKTLLGDKKWKVFGQSYGAYIVYRYIEKHPEGISKAFAHGNAFGVSDMDGSYYRILSQQKVMDRFLKLYPDLKPKFKILKNTLSDKTLCFKTANGQDTCGYEILSHFVYSLGFSDQWKFLVLYIKSIVPKDTVDQNYLSQYVALNISQPFVYRDVRDPNKYTDITNFFYNFAGMYDWDSTPLDYDKCLIVLNRIKTTQKITDDQILMNECLAPIQFEYKDLVKPFLLPRISQFGQKFVQPDQVLKNITLFKIPTFSYSGQLDCFISKDFFSTQIKLAGKKITHTSFEHSGHEGFFTERQVLTDLLNSK